MTVVRPLEADVVVCGGGPAGSTAATLLADAGLRVILCEKARGPRYRVGESLLPHSWSTFERIGVLAALERSAFVRKHSVQFVSTDGRLAQPFFFRDRLDHPSSATWQVWRPDFDALLLDNARAHGVEVLEGVAVDRALVEGGAQVGVMTTDDDPMTIRAPYTVDATGRDALFMKERGWRVKESALDRMAIWTYYRGAVRDPGLDEGATTIAYLPKKGWFWYLAMPDDRVSVGLVARREDLFGDTRDLDAIFAREVARNPWIAQHLATGQRDDALHVTAEYSYRARHCAADGLVLTGDAFAFLDPVFSSGVFLALKSGELAADAIVAAHAAGRVDAACFAGYAAKMKQGIEAMRRLVYAFYDEAFSFGALIRAHPEVHGDLTDCLIGDVFRDFDALFGAVAEQAFVPPPLPHGDPLSTIGTPGAAAR